MRARRMRAATSKVSFFTSLNQLRECKILAPALLLLHDLFVSQVQYPLLLEDPLLNGGGFSVNSVD
jgi:hypothetical protein